ncbi:MAG: plasmid stabilization protein [Gammaproteobacteria bacterium RIFCSPHIGHO2_12_FULL_40_19]|nr:MAG: plasmid stabilization protein [Gammaproteobacteria bacterium RIFCSPHIGHO2_12_FULL_40_19]
MRYTLLIKKRAKKALQSLARTDRNRIAEKIKLLGENPDNPILDIKPLQGSESLHRLRVGQWRIVFDRDDEVKIIAIEKIKPRGGAYK